MNADLGDVLTGVRVWRGKDRDDRAIEPAAGAAVRIVNIPVMWSTRGIDRAIDAARSTRPALGSLLARGAHAGDVATKTLTASRDAALETAERITRREGADGTAQAIHTARSATGILSAEELPIADGGKRVRRIAGKISEDPHDERELHLLLGAVDLDIVLDLHARRAVPRDEFLGALLRQGTPLKWSRRERTQRRRARRSLTRWVLST